MPKLSSTVPSQPAQRVIAKMNGKKEGRDLSADRWFRKFPDIALPQWMKDALAELRVWPVSAALLKNDSKGLTEIRQPNRDTFFFLVAGQATVKIDGTTSVLRPGHCANFLRGAPHSVIHDPAHPLTAICLHYSAFIFESLCLPQVLGFPPVLNFQDNETMKCLFYDACRMGTLRPPGWEVGLSATITQILFAIIWEYGKALKPHLYGVSASDYQRLAPALAFLRNHLAEAPTVGDLAKRASTSESQFRRIFQRSLGQSPVKYMQQLRMERACQLLRTTDLTIEAIAENLGYTEASFFAHTFREHIGLSPGLYRRSATSHD